MLIGLIEITSKANVLPLWWWLSQTNGCKLHC